MMESVFDTFPKALSHQTLLGLMDDTQSREMLLQSIIQRFERKYGVELQALESRLQRGEGDEHPDWEDSIEWRNAVEGLQTNQKGR